MEGTVLGNYRVLSKLGEGGMGVVYLGRHETLGNPVAIKVLQAELSNNAEMVERFFNEARAATSIRHPGIVQIFDFGNANGCAYFVMELLEGASLAARLRERRLDFQECCRIARQIANVLQVAHQRGITHRDLKPDNVFVVPDSEVVGGERVKVLDFGIAKLAGEVHSSGVKTRTGYMMGTPVYMSPEQCKGAGHVDARADIYSLGCILFEMLCGRPPFIGEGVGELVGLHLHVAPPVPHALVPQMPPALSALVTAMLAKSPDQRPPSMSVVGQALDDILRSLGGTPASPTPFPGPPSQNYAAQSYPGFVGPAVPPTTPIAPVQTPTTLGSSAGSTTTPPPAKRKWPLIVGVLAAAGAAAAIAIVVVNNGDKKSEKTVASKPDTPPDKPEKPPDKPDKPDKPDEPAKPKAPDNAWVAVKPPSPAVPIGLSPRKHDEYPKGLAGFRPARKLMSPATAFEIQQHEVTWGELAPFLAKQSVKLAKPAFAPADGDRFPATGVPWKLANDYCASIGGTLPTEAQWELAARGAERRAYPWGSDQLDRMRTHALAGPEAVPQRVMTSSQDRTPDGIYDLLGNAQEWTADLWREDAPGQDESWVVDGETTFRAVRGLPLRGSGAPPDEGTAYREPLCATGTCAPAAAKIQELVGFRCVRMKEGS